jgi:hypothetical protein
MSGDTQRLRERLEAGVRIHERGESSEWPPDIVYLIAQEALPALDRLARLEAVAEAAKPLARLPYPVSSDERMQWLTHQGQLRDAFVALDGEDGTP